MVKQIIALTFSYTFCSNFSVFMLKYFHPPGTT